jgi:uncharacterized membrane protein YfcA
MTISFFILLFIVALLYASVGHGGASGYLALMAVYGFAPEVMKPTALILNLFVSMTSFLLFLKGGHFKWKVFLPFALASIPMSFLGGTISLDAHIYKKVLGVLLLFPVFRFFVFPNTDDKDFKETNLALSLIIGATIGFLSGLIGIGGGILLSPIILLLSWTNQKQTAAISALFIFVNSIAGLAGQMSKGITIEPMMFNYVAVAFAGGIIGAWLGSLKFNHKILKYTLAVVLLMASVKLIVT